jgi:deoxyribodipyrimidine photo-lyase
MYYHLLDADWASNALSWQWVAGSFSSKKYYANQENINKYFYSNQCNTFLDKSYEHLSQTDIPTELKETTLFKVGTNLPSVNDFTMDVHLPIYVHNFFNLDPEWNKQIKANRVLLLEPSFFNQYPVSDNTVQFILELSKNIHDIKIFVGEFEELLNKCPNSEVHYKEHPTNAHYKGIEHNREWLFKDVTGYFSSFSSYWKKCEKYFYQW